jgi:PTS system ascorbate-specific IIA component
LSIGILVVTHGKLGHLLVETIREMIDPLPLQTDVLEVRRVQALDVLLLQGRRMIERLDSNDGVLLLTDAYGSTPSNIATRLAGPAALVVAGVNLPMLMRIFNYPNLSLAEMAQSAVEAGQRGVRICQPCDADGVEPQ